MRMPALSAEASLYKANAYSRAAAMRQAVGGRTSRKPALNSVSAAAAIYVGGLFYCYGEVTGAGVQCYGDGGGGVGEPSCRPRCGPCRPMPEEGPGRFRVCITRDCDADIRRC